MVIRLDSNRVKDVVNNNAEQIGVVGDNKKFSQGMSEADKIVEGARKNIAASGIAENPEAAEKATQDTLHKMANSDQQEPGPEMSINENNELPSVDMLSPNRSPDNPSGSMK
jgi:protein phosphatase PTC1